MGRPKGSYAKSHKSLEERFWEKVVITGFTECWLWGGAKTNGYGSIGYQTEGGGKTKHISSHRAAYQLLIGPIPDNLDLDHLCRNPGCCNPKHLEPVTHRENVLRGEGPSAKQARQTHCKRGHPLSGDNLLPYSYGRVCKTCKYATVKANYKGKSAKDVLGE